MVASKFTNLPDISSSSATLGQLSSGPIRNGGPLNHREHWLMSARRCEMVASSASFSVAISIGKLLWILRFRPPDFQQIAYISGEC